VRLVLLGDPVDHSRSPAIHAAALSAVGIDGTYEARRAGPGDVAEACSAIRAGRLAGANVTMPLKAVAAGMCDRLSSDAERIAAANTLVAGDAEVVGENTDVAGLRSLLARFPADSPVVIMGAGSSSAAALLAAAGREVWVVARSSSQAEAMIAQVGVTAGVGEWEGLSPAGGILVNATPLGMRGEPLPAGWDAERIGIIDLPYGDEPTPAVVGARRRNIPVSDGLDVLVAQAAASFELWTGTPAPYDVMERAARSR
jgi:shikimate dehydrogenase